MVETTSTLNVFTREFQDLCSQNSEFESVEVAVTKRFTEVSGTGCQRLSVKHKGSEVGSSQMISSTQVVGETLTGGLVTSLCP